ncbi:hypothetical protein [Novimethylophilus sp.]|uniref:hypothetical protein n=1 Tax=Novimethylophilus sp. TaxID=2137426 RepID=UPI002F40DA00
MAISSATNSASISATNIQRPNPAKEAEDKKALQQAEVKPADAAQPAAASPLSTLGSIINTTA